MIHIQEVPCQIPSLNESHDFSSNLTCLMINILQINGLMLKQTKRKNGVFLTILQRPWLQQMIHDWEGLACILDRYNDFSPNLTCLMINRLQIYGRMLKQTKTNENRRFLFANFTLTMVTADNSRSRDSESNTVTEWISWFFTEFDMFD